MSETGIRFPVICPACKQLSERFFTFEQNNSYTITYCDPCNEDFVVFVHFNLTVTSYALTPVD